MAKKKKSDWKPADFETDEEYTAYIFTRLLAVINTKLKPELAYSIVLDMVHDGLGEDNVDEFGSLILTIGEGHSEEMKH